MDRLAEKEEGVAQERDRGADFPVCERLSPMSNVPRPKSSAKAVSHRIPLATALQNNSDDKGTDKAFARTSRGIGKLYATRPFCFNS
jgi:hypothetical protein